MPLVDLDRVTVITIACSIIGVATCLFFMAAWLRAAQIARRRMRKLQAVRGRVVQLIEALDGAQLRLDNVTAQLDRATARHDQITGLLRELHTDIKAVRSDQIGQVTAPLLPPSYRPPTAGETARWSSGAAS